MWYPHREMMVTRHLENPIQTISSGARRAQPGDTILVQEGIYRERVTPIREVDPVCRLLIGQRGKRVFIRGQKYGHQSGERRKGNLLSQT